jgi:hypothetical protein
MKVYQYMGYEIRRGGYHDTSDDRADRWYVDDPQSDMLDHRNAGFATVAEAKAAIRETGAWAAAYNQTPSLRY